MIAGTIRLLMVALGGWWLAAIGAPAWMLFALVSAAMVAYGVATVIAIAVTRWGD